MRKHVLKALIAVFAAVCSLAIVVACGPEETPPPVTEYTVTYVGGTGAQGTAPASEKHAAGAKFNVAANTFTLEGKTFTAWNDGEKNVTAGSEYTMPAKNVTFTAQWQDNGPAGPTTQTYTVTFVGGEGATGTAPTETPKKAGDKFNLPANTFTKADSLFSKWNDGTADYAAGAEYTMPAKNVTFTAQWTPVPTDPLVGLWATARIAQGSNWSEYSVMIGEEAEGVRPAIFMNHYYNSSSSSEATMKAYATVEEGDTEGEYEIGGELFDDTVFKLVIADGEGSLLLPTADENNDEQPLTRSLLPELQDSEKIPEGKWYLGAEFFDVKADGSVEASINSKTGTGTVTYLGDCAIFTFPQSAELDQHSFVAEYVSAEEVLVYIGDDANSLTPHAPATITFDANGASGSAPEAEVGVFANGKWPVTLPENPYTVPANSYFRGWEIEEVTYFPGEVYDAEPGATVSVKAIWQSELLALELTPTLHTPWDNGYTVPVYKDAPTETVLTMNITSNTPSVFSGFLVDIHMTLKGASGDDFIRLRVDSYAFTNNNDTEHVATAINIDSSKWNAETYTGMFSSGKTVIQRATAKLEGKVLTYTVSNYPADTTDFVNTEATVSAKYTVESEYDVDSLALVFYADDGDSNDLVVVSTKANVYSALSANQTPSESSKIEVGETGNILGYTGMAPVWTSKLLKGEKMVLTGEMTASGSENYHAPIMYLFDAATVSPDFNMRTDVFVVGNTTSNAVPFGTPEGWSVATSTARSRITPSSTGASDVDKWWNGVKEVLKSATVEITFDLTGTDLFVSIKAASKTNSDVYYGDFTISKGTASAFPESYIIGLGGESCHLQITGLVLSH